MQIEWNDLGSLSRLYVAIAVVQYDNCEIEYTDLHFSFTRLFVNV